MKSNQAVSTNNDRKQRTCTTRNSTAILISGSNYVTHKIINISEIEISQDAYRAACNADAV